MMKFASNILILILLSLMAVACGGNGGYVIECDFEGLGDRGVEMVTSDGRKVTRRQLHPREGRFKAEGQSTQPELVELFTLDGGSLLFSCVASDGDRLKVRMNMKEGPASLVIEGPDDWKDYGAWIAENDSLLEHGDDAEVNRLILLYVDAHKESPTASLLVATRYRAHGNELRADSVMNLIEQQGRPACVTASFMASLGRGLERQTMLKRFIVPAGRDTTITYAASEHSYTLFAINSERKPDSVKARLRALYKDLPARRLDIMELSVARDSATWRGQILNDSARWHQGWVSGGVASPRLRDFAIPRLPYYVLADSMGQVVYTGESLDSADRMVRTRLARFAKKRDEEKADPATVKEAKTDLPKPRQANGPGVLKMKAAGQ